MPREVAQGVQLVTELGTSQLGRTLRPLAISVPPSSPFSHGNAAATIFLSFPIALRVKITLSTRCPRSRVLPPLPPAPCDTWSPRSGQAGWVVAGVLNQERADPT